MYHKRLAGLENFKLPDIMEESVALLNALSYTLTKLKQTNPDIFFSFVMKCKDSKYYLADEELEILRRLSLLNFNDSIHQTVQNIVLASFVDQLEYPEQKIDYSLGHNDIETILDMLMHGDDKTIKIIAEKMNYKKIDPITKMSRSEFLNNLFVFLFRNNKLNVFLENVNRDSLLDLFSPANIKSLKLTGVLHFILPDVRTTVIEKLPKEIQAVLKEEN